MQVGMYVPLICLFKAYTENIVKLFTLFGSEKKTFPGIF